MSTSTDLDPQLTAGIFRAHRLDWAKVPTHWPPFISAVSADSEGITFLVDGEKPGQRTYLAKLVSIIHRCKCLALGHTIDAPALHDLVDQDEWPSQAFTRLSKMRCVRCGEEQKSD